MEHELPKDLSTSHPLKFIISIVVMGALGVATGGLVELAVTQIHRDSNNQAKCGGLLILQLTIIATVILISTLLFKNKNLFSLLNGDWKGRLFLLTFFVAQASIALNIQCLFKLNYNII